MVMNDEDVRLFFLRRGGTARTFGLIMGAACVIVIATAVAVISRYPRTLIIADSGLSNAAGTADENKVLSSNASGGNPLADPSTPRTPIDAAAYDQKLLAIAHIPPAPAATSTTSSSAMGNVAPIEFPPYAVAPGRTALARLWPVKAPYPTAGALLPFKRIVAYYGNLYSKQMGVLGEYPPDQMLAMLASTTAEWAAADPSTPVVPALDYIVVTAQASAGKDGKYRARMPDDQTDQIVQMADRINGIVVLDVQVGLSNVETEVPLLEQYLKMPNVELALDPEFDMHNGERPGTVIGTMDASDINWAAHYLADLVQQNDLPPKILIVHRFTQDMVTNTDKITPLPEVQIVMDMDGFGVPAKKIGTYYNSIEPYPVQFTGFKLFYKNDANASGSHMMAPAEVLRLSPQPSFIQYQ
ncbi:MAG: hypothetical protein P4M11_02535 [Candidatus Pacebacteria bacterium]|nr:hypothetical protein [Candidatus Paceibacterota bacterium]